MVYIRFFTAVAWVLCLGHATVVSGQDSPKPVSNTYFIQNCTLISRPGVVQPGQHVLVRNGLITETGPNIKPPFDAQIIKADSMYVYAGFIDAASNTGIPKTENKDRPKAIIPGNPPNDVAGITPDVLASQLYKPADKSVSEMRNAGFTLSHTFPRGLMLPGQSAVYLLGDGVGDKLLLSDATAQHFQYETQRGVYPSTTIGVMAKFRDLYKNAQLAGNHEAMYKKAPTGLERPDYSRELQALYPAATGKQPIYVVAQKTKDVHRSMMLQKELGFQLVLMEVKQGWHYLNEIKQANFAVLLSLELPEEEKKEAKKDEGKESKSDAPVSSVEKDSFNLRKDLAVREYVQQAAAFEKAGIEFGFSFLNTKPGDARKAIGRMIKAGLSEKAALQALTTYPARLLGLASVAGTVEKGKMANLVLTDKPLFDEKAVIRMVFVDGKKYLLEMPPAKADKKPEEKSAIAGKWTYQMEAAGTVRRGTIDIQRKEGQYHIVVTDDAQKEKQEKARDISFKDGNLKFHVVTDLEQAGKVEFDLTFKDKRYEGTLSVASFGSFPVKGERQGDPE